MKTIRIIDDYENAPVGDKELAERWKSGLESLLPSEDYKIDLLSSRTIKEEIATLEKRRMDHRSGTSLSIGESLLDSTDLLVVDFDLLYLEGEPGISGEDIAYLTRCFSTCGLIVGLNRFKKQGDFNLNLFSQLDSYSDYDISGKWLTDPGLWFPEPSKWQDFRPWYWPSLTTEIENFPERVKQAHSWLDQPILNTFGFPDAVKTSLPRVLGGFLEGNAKTYDAITFAEFVQCSPNALRGKEDRLPEELAARVAAARIHAWLERALLPRLDILIDGPHLIQEYASLLNDKMDINSWNGAAHLTQPQIDRERIGGQAWKADIWLSRPAWWRDEVAENRNLDEVRNPWGVERPNYVFCEDISRFQERSIARRFVAETNSPFAQHYVTQGIERISYAPAVRLAM